MTPDSALQLQKLGYECVVESGAGVAAGFADALYREAGVEVVKTAAALWKAPIVYDASHSVQKPGANKGVSSGDSKFISPLAKAAVAIGIDALFIESHPNPSKAISDGDNSMNINDIENLLKEIIDIDKIIRKGV